MISNVPIYEDVPRYDRITKYILGGIILSTLIVGLILLPFDLVGAVIMFAVTVLDEILIRCILPNRFQIYEERFRISLGGPFAVNMFFTNITGIEKADTEASWAFLGMRFVTSSKYVIQVDRKNGLSVVFSPSKGEEFLEELKRAKADFREPDFSVFLNK